MWNQNEGVQLNNKGMSTNRYGTVAPEEGRRGHPQSVREFSCCVLCSMISRKDSNVKRIRSRMSFMFPWLVTYTDLIYLVELELARTERDGLRIFFLPFPFLLLPSIFWLNFLFFFTWTVTVRYKDKDPKLVIDDAYHVINLNLMSSWIKYHIKRNS